MLKHIQRSINLINKKQSLISFINNSLRQFNSKDNVERESLDYDLLIVGGGAAGLSSAIKFKQLCMQNDVDYSVAVIEKGAQIGNHILSGNCFEPRALNELIPDWKEKNAPLLTEVTRDNFYILTEKYSFPIPNIFLPDTLKNHGNYIISLGDLCIWLAGQAEELGVDIFPGFAADKILFNDDNSVGGVITNDFGINKKGEKKDNFSPGMQINANQTIFAEGCRGSLSEKLIKHYNLRENSMPQCYGIGLKEVWQVNDNKNFEPGLVSHTSFWPLSYDAYGGSFMYHMKPNLIHIGFVLGLDYKNPYINAYEEFQRFKTHPNIRKFLEGGEVISYGARCLNEGGLHSLPKLTFPGGALAGCSAGFLNVAKIKGAHTAMKSGMLAVESIFNKIKEEESTKKGAGADVVEYENELKKSWVYSELNETRNFKGAFHRGLYFGLAHGFVSRFTKGKEPWTFTVKTVDSETTSPKENFKKINYAKPDGVLTFDILTNLAKSGTNHEHDQPSHLKIKKGKEEFPIKLSLEKYDGPEQRFCPAKVYEFVEDDKGKSKLHINAQNCLHCKCCSIKTPGEYIDWNVPEGGGGPG